MPRDWSAFDGFVRPFEQPSWAGVVAWASAIEAQLGVERSALARQRVASDRLLHDLGGDPSARDWTGFLPLRRDREEDWSDWLAQILEDSSTGQFAWALLGAIEKRSVESYATPVVHRELPYEGYRADLVIEWTDGSYTHLEVKVGDPALAKTLDTAEKVAKRFGRGQRRGCDAILFLPPQREAWDRACDALPAMRDRVHPLTWLDVARALRRALPQSAGESIHWRVWAHAFSGEVEQDLLYMRSGRDPHTWARSLPFTALNTAAVLFTPDGDDS